MARDKDTEVVLEYSRRHGNTTYVHASWGWTVYCLGDNGWVPWVGYPAGINTRRAAEKEVRQFAREHNYSLSGHYLKRGGKKAGNE